jgi:hypothetical protein
MRKLKINLSMIEDVMEGVDRGYERVSVQRTKIRNKDFRMV